MHVVSLDDGEHQAAPTVENSETQKVAANETPGRIDPHLYDAHALPLLVQHVSHEFRVILHPLFVIAQAAVRKVLEVSPETADRSADLRVLVHLVSAPTATAPIEQPDQSIRIGIAVPQEAVEVVGDARDRPAG